MTNTVAIGSFPLQSSEFIWNITNIYVIWWVKLSKYNQNCAVLPSLGCHWVAFLIQYIKYYI